MIKPIFLIVSVHSIRVEYPIYVNQLKKILEAYTNRIFSSISN